MGATQSVEQQLISRQGLVRESLFSAHEGGRTYRFTVILVFAGVLAARSMNAAAAGRGAAMRGAQQGDQLI
jgi:hypothetical protein